MKRNLIAAHGQTLAVLRKCLILFTMLLAVSLSAKAEREDAEGGIADKADIFVGNLEYTIFYDGTAAVRYYLGEPTDVIIPDFVEYEGVTYSVRRILGTAFADCTSLASVTIPNSVTSIEFEAFCGCTSLTSVTIPNSVTEIEGGAFWGCTSLTSITLPNSLTSIWSNTFTDCTSLTSVTIPNSVTSIGIEAFGGCTSLTSVTIPNSVASIGDQAFAGCTSLASVTIPNSVTSIEDYAFNGCTSLASVTIPNSVTSIGKAAFGGCTSLASVTIPNTVTHIYNFAFWNCKSLKTVYSLSSTPPTLWELTFYNVHRDAVAYVPEGTAKAYTKTFWYRDFDIREMTSTGVSEPAVDHKASPVDVYNMQGMLVKTNASQTDIDGLAHGLYIIGGRKVLVK